MLAGETVGVGEGVGVGDGDREGGERRGGQWNPS